MIQNASSGLALQGVLVSRKLNDLTSKRDVVLQPPDDVQLMGPSIDQQSKSWYFTSERHEERVTAIVDTLGYSVAKLAKVGERGVSLELCGAFKSVYEEEKGGASIIQDDNFNSTVKYSFLPVKSFSFSDQLCLSSDALVHLKEIDEKYSSNEEEIKAQCIDFLHKFGSHVYTGPLHFGGKYRLRSSSSGFKESERRDVQKLQGEVIANQERSGSTSAPVMISTMDGDFYRKYSDALVSQTSLEVNLTGGHLVVRDYSEWVRGLEASNSTWSLIDRGTERVPVWDVFKKKHANDFHNSSALVDIMKQAWETMNKKSSIADENNGKGEEQTEAIHSESAPTASAAEERNITEKYKYVPVPREEQTGARDSESAKKSNVTENYVPTSIPQYLIKGKEQTGARDGEDAAKTKVTEYTPTTTFQDDKQREEAKALIGNLGLTEYYPQKLTVLHSLQIREDTLDIANSTAEGTRDKSIASVYPQLYPFRILQKLMAFDCRCRIGLTSHSPDSDDDDEKEIETIVHPMDGLLALLHCSDNFLRQDLMCRLATCQLAVPLLLPDPITHEPTFLLWAMRTIVKEFKIGNGTASYSGPIVGYPAPIVSFLRIGHHSKSKSHLLNTIINTTEYPTFFHWNCEGGRAKRILVNGLVEVSWYLPSNDDNLFPDAVSFANLHGDAREHSKQVQFLSEVSCMHFVFLNENDLNDATLEVLKNLSQAPGGIAILQSERSASNKSLQGKLLVKMPREKWSVLKLFNKSDYGSKCRIQKTILAIVGQKTNLKLEQCKDLAHKCVIAVDEDDPDCITGRGLANEVLTIIEKFKEMNPGKSPKKLLVLQSSDLWQKWAAMDKEQYRQTRRGQMSMLEYGELQREKMDMVRKTQLHNAQNLTSLIASFLNSLLKHKGPITWYYLHWLKLILDNLSRELLPPLHSRYKQKRKELNDIQMQEKKDEIAEKLCRDDMNKLNIELINASFGPEHLLREMSQMYEAVISQDSAPSSLKKKISGFPEIAAQLLVDGFPLELMDGDAAHVPKDWISAVLEKVSDILKITTSNPQLFVLSVLGLQSTGKSTMMNTLFGVQFTVSAGRCTRGAFMQLLPVHSSLQKKCGFQYFLIIDTEGLRAPEPDALQTQKHDNELATFVIGMANLTIMNIYGEIAGDMDDILQTTVHAFLRMSEVKLRPSCHFVHQNVPAVAAGDKAMMGRLKVKDKLDGMTQEAAKEAGLQARYFNQVIQFDYENDVSFFPSLWTGSPPKAPVNTGYSVEAQVLKHHLINCTKKSLKSLDNSVLQLKQHLEELWKAILQENFVFSFKNTFEIVAFKTLEEQYSDWSWSLKNDMIKWEHESQMRLMSCTIKDLPTIYRGLKDSLPQYVGKIYQDLEAKMNTFFDESSEQEIISKWKYDTEVRLRTLCAKLQTHAENHCKQLFSSRKIRATAEKTKEKMSVDILERVKELASTLEKGKMNDKELKEVFEQSWIEWIRELTAGTEKIEGPNVKFEVEKVVSDMLNTHQKLVMQRLSDSAIGKPLEQWGIHLRLQVRHVHLKLSQPSSWGGRYGMQSSMRKLVGAGMSIDDFLHPAQQDTDIILKYVKDYLNKKQSSGENFNPAFTTELLQELFNKIGKVQNDQFYFTAEYKVDMALTACGHALHVFVEMADAFRKKHDPFEYIESEMKDNCLYFFMDQYNQIAQEITAASTLCQLLKKPVRDQVMYGLSLAIVRDIRGRKLWIRYKPSLKAKVLLDIGEKLAQGRGSFSDCALYLKDAKQSLYYWVKLYITSFSAPWTN